uniref:(northern house mosquito) hypothetical protein n=1 Tax=Culex pipiens TaxID=7175 RepID=A0A8D8C014_CULPI
MSFSGYTPREIKSAGFSAVGMCLHSNFLLSFRIAATRLRTNTEVSGFKRFNQSRTICESVQSTTRLMSSSTASRTLTTCSTISFDAQSSSRGMVRSSGSASSFGWRFNSFNGATLDFAHNSIISAVPSRFRLRKYTEQPYPFIDASAKPWSS